MDNSAGITRTVVLTYRSQFWLLWRIMLPVVLLAPCVDIALFLPGAMSFTTTGEFAWRVDTVSGISTMDFPRREAETAWIFSPLPSFTSTKDDGSAWTWSFDLRNFRNVSYYYYNLLLFVLCPLSFAVAKGKITARETWRHTQRNIWKVLGTNLVLVFILGGISIGFSYLFSYLDTFRSVPPNWLLIGSLVHCYVLVYCSLYNPCLMLEKHSVLSVFRRSYALVKRNWWRFFRIYLVTSWITSTLISVLLGLALLLFSIAVPELSAVREMLLPFNFFTLFLGANVEVSVANLPVPTTVAILLVRGLIFAFLVPIWAIVTTRLYLEEAC